MTQPKDPLAFLLFADNELPLGQELERQKQFRALMMYSLLFEPVLIMPDVFAINNLNFRRAIKNDPAVGEMIARGYIQFARREENGQQVSILELRDRTLEKAKNAPWENFPVGLYFPYDEYRESISVESMDNQGTHHPYLLSNLGQRYTQTWLNTTVEQLTDRLGNINIAEEVWEATQKEAEIATMLTRNFYWQLADQLDTHLQIKGQNDTVGQRLKQIATGYYITGLPEEKGGSPLYSDEHSASIDIVRGRVGCLASDLADDRVVLESGFSPKELVSALLFLNADHLDVLRNCSEWKQYRNAITAMNNRKDVLAAYKAYTWQIENVLKVVIGGNLQPSEIALIIKTNPLMGDLEWVYSDWSQAGIEIATPILESILGVGTLGTFGAFSLARCIYKRIRGTDPRSKAKGRAADLSNHEQEMTKLYKDLKQRGQEGELPTEQIDATMNMTKMAHDIGLGVRKR